MLQSIRQKVSLRQVIWRPPKPRRWRWLWMGGHPFLRSLILPLCRAVVIPVIVFGPPATSAAPRLTTNQLFQNPSTRAILQAMTVADLPLAHGVVDFLCTLASVQGVTGDALIQWNATATSDYNDGAQMHLNGTFFDPNNPYTIASFAGQITHEAVEIYFAQADGVPANTLPMDYLAEYEGGLVMWAVGPANPGPDDSRDGDRANRHCREVLCGLAGKWQWGCLSRRK